jgi:hypothetical protein
MGHPEDDVIERRLRTAKPPQAAAERDPGRAYAELWPRIVASPAPRPAGRRPRRLALPAALACIVAVAAVVVAAGPSGLRSPAGAGAAISRSLHWFDPPAGTVLHVRSDMTSRRPAAPATTLTQESWQSVDHPGEERRVEPGVETDAAGDLYDAATNTIYAYVAPSAAVLERRVNAAIGAKIRGARASGADPAVIEQLRRDRAAALRKIAAGQPLSEPDQAHPPVGDALVGQMRHLLLAGDAQVGEETTHDGVAAFPITVRYGQARWTMWTRADDGKPLELRIEGHGPVQLGPEGLETVRWPAYEVLPADRADGLLSVAGAHPDARVIRDAGAYAAAERRLFPHG